jgi:hypothetical protein
MGDQPDFYPNVVPAASQYTPYQTLIRHSASNVAISANAITAVYSPIPDDGFVYMYTKFFIRFTCKGPTEINVAYALDQAVLNWLSLGRKVGELSVEFDLTHNPVFQFVYPNAIAFLVNNEEDVARAVSYTFFGYKYLIPV